MPPFRPRPDVQVATLAEVDLPGWLAIATYNLEPAAKQRIKLEIGSHFNEAIAAYLADGLTPYTAEATALGDLGDAQTAAKRFKKTYLTADEAKSMIPSLKLAAKPFFSLGVLWMDCGAILPAALLFFTVPGRFGFFAGFTAGMILLGYLCYRFFPRLLFLGNALSRKRLALAILGCQIGVAVLMMATMTADSHGMGAILWGALIGRHALKAFAVWSKLRFDDHQITSHPTLNA